MRQKLIAGNWKMNLTLAEAMVLANGVRNHLEDFERILVVLCPSTIWLTEIAHAGIGPKQLPHLKLGAQNVFNQESGAYTGETSILQIKEVVEFVIIGHSERTHIFKENPDLIATKVQASLDHGVIPILCIGEDQKEEGSVRNLVHRLNYLVKDLNQEELERLVLAYEPVWAIGTGNPATPEYAQEVIVALREVLTPVSRILYGGSVTEENAEGFLQHPDIDGFLIGGTSLKLKPFLQICEMAENLSEAK